MERRTLKHNPGFFEADELVDNFVVRQSDLDEIIRIIGENTAKQNRHILASGPRGSGKTMLVNRVAIAAERDDRLRERWYPLVFAEESYNATSIGNFWLESLKRLSLQTGEPDWENACNGLLKDDLARQALDKLLEYATDQGKKILLVVENLNTLLSVFRDDDVSDLIRTLEETPKIMMLATATDTGSLSDKIQSSLRRMFEFIKLEPLKDDECAKLWDFIADKPLDRSQYRPITLLTGGNARLVTMFARFDKQRSFRGLVDEFVELIDDHTEYFKSQLENLPSQECQLYVALAALGGEGTAKEVAKETRIEVSTVSAQLARLVGRGKVLIDKTIGSRRYVIAESIMKYYCQMRFQGGQKTLVKTAVAFMVDLYGRETVEKIVVTEASNLSPTQRRDHNNALEEIALATTSCSIEPERSRENRVEHDDEVAAILDEIDNRLDMAASLFAQGRYKSVKIACQSIVAQYGDREETQIVSLVAKAMRNIGLVMSRMVES